MVIKRDGRRVAFDETRIYQAILRAGTVTGEFDSDVAARLAADVARTLRASSAGAAISIEKIQDQVELNLIHSGYLKTARAYIVYREQRKVQRADRRSLVDVEASINEYLTRQDWRVAANANQGYSLGGLILNISGKLEANYWLNHVYPSEIGAAHRSGDVHIHDLDMLSGYCAGWSLRTFLMEGLNGVPGRVEALPPKHMHSAIGQIVNFLGTLQNEWAGAQAFSSFDTYMAPFVRRDRMRYEDVRQCIQELIFNLTSPLAGARRLPSPISPSTGPAPRTFAARCPSLPARSSPSPTASSRRRWT